MIRTISDCFFGNKKGIIVDNAYDAYILHNLVRYYEDNHILFLKSQDNDLGFLNKFAKVEYLSLPQEACNFDNLNKLKALRGISVYSSKVCMIDLDILNRLEYVDIIYDDKAKIDFDIFESVKFLRLFKYPFSDLCMFNSLEYLELNYCKKIVNLQFLERLTSLRSLKLSYLPALKDIQSLKKFKQSLEKISIVDCKKIDNVETTLSKLKKIKDIQIVTEITDTNLVLKSLDFIKELFELEVFATNYKIEDGDLSQLLKLKDANITAYYKHYNLKDKLLPHENVVIEDNGLIRRVKLSSLEKNKDDPRIIWEN